MQQFLIGFEHDSRHLSANQLLVTAVNFKSACGKVNKWRTTIVSSASGFTWNEGFDNARNFINLTIN